MTRNHDAISKIIAGAETSKKEKNNNNKEVEINSKKDIQKFVNDSSSSARKADSIRINPVLSASLRYWTSIMDTTLSKPDIVEKALLEYIPEDILKEGYEIAKKQNLL